MWSCDQCFLRNTNKSGVTGQGMKEAQNINKSLSALGDVIQSLVGKSSHTPYRNSKLTMMLKDSLGGDSKTLMTLGPGRCLKRMIWQAYRGVDRLISRIFTYFQLFLGFGVTRPLKLRIVCVSPAQFNVTEPLGLGIMGHLKLSRSLSALNFASRARNVELGKESMK